MQVKHVRTGKIVRLPAPQQFLARERTAVEEAWPGDVIGVVDKGTLRIGDTLSPNGRRGVSRDPALRAGALRAHHRHGPDAAQAARRGAPPAHRGGRGAGVLHRARRRATSPVIGAVGMLQFDVMLFRLEHEYGAPCRLEKLPCRYPRWVEGPEAAIERASRGSGRMRLYDAKGMSLLVFDELWTLRSTRSTSRRSLFTKSRHNSRISAGKSREATARRRSGNDSGADCRLHTAESIPFPSLQ